MVQMTDKTMIDLMRVFRKQQDKDIEISRIADALYDFILTGLPTKEMALRIEAEKYLGKEAM